MSTFFLLDDNRSIRNMFEIVLEIKGHRLIDDATNCDECLKKLLDSNLAETPDFLLMDQQLPVETYMDAIKRILEQCPELQIIFISDDDEIKDDVLSAGAAGFLKKPFSIEKFYNSIDKLKS